MTALQRSEIDSRRFSVRVGRAQVADEDAAREVLAAAGVDLVIARVPVARLDLAQRLESAGAFLCGTLIRYEGATAGAAAPESPPGEVLRPYRDEDAEGLERLARAGFAGLQGHYHADPRLDGAAATEGYVEWARTSAEDPSGVALVTEVGGALSGFVTCRVPAEGPGDVLLNAVDPGFQRRGIYGRLFRAVCARLAARGVARVEVSTQLANWAPQRVWVRAGLEPREASYTLHLWR